MTIKGVQKILRDKGAAYVASLCEPLEEEQEISPVTVSHVQPDAAPQTIEAAKPTTATQEESSPPRLGAIEEIVRARDPYVMRTHAKDILPILNKLSVMAKTMRAEAHSA